MLSFQLAHISNQSCKYTTVYNYDCDWNNFVASIKDEQPRCATVKGELKTSQKARSQSTSVSRPSNPDPAFPNPQINLLLATPTRLGRHAGHTQGVVLLGANIGAIWCPHHQRCKHTRKRGLNKPQNVNCGTAHLDPCFYESPPSSIGRCTRDLWTELYLTSRGRCSKGLSLYISTDTNHGSAWLKDKMTITCPAHVFQHSIWRLIIREKQVCKEGVMLDCGFMRVAIDCIVVHEFCMLLEGLTNNQYNQY